MVVGGGSESREVFVVVKMEEIQHVCMEQERTSGDKEVAAAEDRK